MKKIITSLVLLCSFFPAAAQELEWGGQIGGTSTHTNTSMVVDGSGNVYMAGTANGLGDYDPGTDTMYLSGAGSYVLKMDSSGTLIWATKFWANSAPHLAVDAQGNIYATGTFTGIVDFDPSEGVHNLTATNATYLLKLNSDGGFLWVKSIEGLVAGSAITIDNGGNIIIAGTFSSTVDFDPGTTTAEMTSEGSGDIFTLKVDGLGNFLWVSRIGGALGDVSPSVTVDSSGNVLTGGTVYGTVSITGSNAPLTASAAGDMLIAKFSPSGSFVSALHTPGSLAFTNALNTDAEGNLYAIASFSGETDVDPTNGVFNLTAVSDNDAVILKFGPSGDFLWAKQLSSPLYEDTDSITTDAAGNVYVSGLFMESIDADPGSGETLLTVPEDVQGGFIIKLNTEGNFLWVNSLEAESLLSASPNIIAADSTGAIYSSGAFGGTLSFTGEDTFGMDSSAGNIYIFKLSPETMRVPDTAFQTPVVYPNPTTGNITINLNAEYFDADVKVINQVGQVVTTYKSGYADVLPVNITGAAGIYFVEVKAANLKPVYIKIVKQ